MTQDIASLSNQMRGVVDRDDFIGQFHSQQLAYTSMQAETEEEKKNLFNLMNNPDYRLSEFINKEIDLQHIYIEVVELEKKDRAGNVQLGADGLPLYNKAPRIVLVDSKGKGYQCVSVGVLGSLKKMQSVFGAFPWNPARKISVKQMEKGSNRILNLEIS